jgi:membrane-associated protease RseP (regulator of RpoE activity)
MSRTTLLLPLRLAAASVLFAGWAATLAAPCAAEPTEPARVLRVDVKPEPRGLVVAGGGAGPRHELRVVSDDGSIGIETEADPDKAWLGVVLSTEEQGLVVKGVMKDSPAEAAGVEPGDVIVEVEGRRVEPDSGSLLDGRSPGDRLDLTVERDGERMRLRPRLTGRPARMELGAGEGLGAFELAGDLFSGMEGLAALESLKTLPDVLCLKSGQAVDPDCFGLGFAMLRGPRLGVVVESMSEQLAAFFGVEAGRGVLVKEVLEDTPAARAGIQAGDVLMRVGDEEIGSPSDVRGALRDAEAGDSLRIDVLRRGARQSFDVVIEKAAPEASMGWPGPEAMEAMRRAEASGALESRLGAEQREEVRQELARARAEIERASAEQGRAMEGLRDHLRVMRLREQGTVL